MAEAYLITTQAGYVPASEDDREILKPKSGEVIKVTFTRPRNMAFHRKLFALFKIAFDSFEPQETKINGRYIKPEADFTEFRYWLVIKAGFFHIVGYPDGSVRVRAKSLATGNMTAETFEKVYEAIITVVLKDVLTNYSRDDIDQVVSRVLEFA